MKALITLIKREYWENRGNFFTLPALFGGCLLLIAICFLILFLTKIMPIHVNGQVYTVENAVPPVVVSSIAYAISLPFTLVVWPSLFNYFLNCLYDDRKDRSILFWQSMPIADWQTILSKAAAGTILIPMCSFICIVITELVLILILTITAKILDLDLIASWLWNPLAFIMSWLHILALLFFQVLWLFPLLGWCMLCSAYAKKSPFLTLIIPFIVLSIIETIFFHDKFISAYIISRFHLAMSAWRNVLGAGPYIAGKEVIHLPIYSDTSLYLGLAIGAGFMVIAGYLRHTGYRFDD